MVETVKLLNIVALTIDLPDYNLWRGQVGTVVDEPLPPSLPLLKGDGGARK
jgi:hypothetical protein